MNRRTFLQAGVLTHFGASLSLSLDLDHWGRVYSTVLAGGGIRGGRVYGRSDKQGGLPADNPVHTSDFFATIYHALGYGPDTHVTDLAGRPYFFVPGKPVLDLL